MGIAMLHHFIQKHKRHNYFNVLGNKHEEILQPYGSFGFDASTLNQSMFSDHIRSKNLDIMVNSFVCKDYDSVLFRG